MQKYYTSLGLMSGTSGDGVDASIIYSNGIDEFEVIKDKYFEYDSNIHKNIHSLKEKIFNLNDYNKRKNLKNKKNLEVNEIDFSLLSAIKSFIILFITHFLKYIFQKKYFMKIRKHSF